MTHPNHTNETHFLRDHMANERTFLAWIRTSIGIMAFGFVVEKFSIFLSQFSAFFGTTHLAPVHHVSPVLQGYSKIFGMILVGLGALICLLAFIKYKKIKQQINEGTYQSANILDMMLTLIVCAIGLFLTIYLFNSI